MIYAETADIQNKKYGVWRWNKQTKKMEFSELGDAILISGIEQCIETNEISLLLKFDYLGTPCIERVPRDIFSEPRAHFKKLTALGANVPQQHIDIVLATLEQQEAEFAQNGGKTRFTFNRTGWMLLPKKNDNPKLQLVYRSHKLIGSDIDARYTGPLDLKPRGDLTAWTNMVNDEVIGNPKLELVLLTAMSAIVYSPLSFTGSFENPIVHLCGLSGSGKTTAGNLAASVCGKPFDGKRLRFDKTGKPMSKISVKQSWSSTAKATVTSLAGNMGSIIVLDELGKFVDADLTPIVYNFSEGTDRKRLSNNLEARTSDYFATTILSIGEISLLGRCANMPGLAARVLELEAPFTTCAEHSRRLKECCAQNHGLAAPILAGYIIENGGIRFVQQLYKQELDKTIRQAPHLGKNPRFVEKFVVPFLISANVANAALGLKFDISSLRAYLLELAETKLKESDIGLASYDVILEICRTKESHFSGKHKVPSGDHWGVIKTRPFYNQFGDYVTEQFCVRKNILFDLLAKNGYDPRTCLKLWRERGWLDCDAPHFTKWIYNTGNNKARERLSCVNVIGTAPTDEEEHQPVSTRIPAITDQQ